MKKIHIGFILGNTEKLAGFYEKITGDKVGFVAEDGYREIPTTVQAVWAFEPESCVVADVGKIKLPKIMIRIQVEDIQVIYQKCKDLKVKMLSDILSFPYGQKQLYIFDPENNLVQFFEVI